MTSNTTFKKKTLTTVALGVSFVFVLAGCTQGNDGGDTVQLQDKTVEQLPEWDVRELVPGSWYNADNSTPSAEDVSNPDDIPGMTDDVFLPNWVTFLDDETSCRITGRVLHAPASMEGRSDDFNSRDYIYSMVPFESAYGELSIIDVNGTDFIQMDNFVGPNDEGTPGWHHRAASRVFSSVLDIEGMMLEGDTTGAHGSSLLQGLPVAYIDFSCEDEANLTDERWMAGLKNFSLLFETPSEGPSDEENTGEPAPAPAEDTAPAVEEETPTPVEGEETPSDETVTTEPEVTDPSVVEPADEN